MSSEFWSVAVDAPIFEPLTYQAPQELKVQLCRGSLVDVPLGRRRAKGVLLNPIEQKPKMDLKFISSIETDFSPLPNFFLSWLEWVSQYYIHPIGSVAALAFPSLKKSTKGNSTRKSPIIKETMSMTPPNLTLEQKTVVAGILAAKNFSTHLLFGVTGSGKTEVYLRLLEKIISEGKRGLVLVPEISLTPQLIQRFAERFGNQIAVLHSQLTDRERTNQWWEMVGGKKNILIGARSALFCPIHDLGLIIVDEEHEPSFKQEEKLKYHARDCAIMLAKFANCPVVLGSATPSMESWKNAKEGKYFLHEMRSRVEDRAMPTIETIDLRAATIDENKENSTDLPKWLSHPLYKAMTDTLLAKKQVALFLNRRGVAPLVICPACGFTYECPNCDINLTLHGKTHLVCHYCDYHENFKEACPDCKEGEMTAVGLGTEQLEKEIRHLFPEANVARADRDEISNRADLEELIQKMETGETDILIGTQMIAKGLDFKNLNLVGLILADVGFNIPDFRSTERSFQLVTQVSGRAGRHVKPGEAPGRVIIQTYNPDHPSLTFSKEKDYVSFATQELSHRAALLYPPYGRLISIRMQGVDLSKVQKSANLFATRGQQLKSQNNSYLQIEILGPAASPLSRIRGQFRYHLLLKGPDSGGLNRFCRHLVGDKNWLPSGIRLLVDVDPINLL